MFVWIFRGLCVCFSVLFFFLVLYSFVVEFCANVVFSNMRYHIRNGIHRLCVIRFSSSRWKMSSTNKRQEETIPNRIDHCESIEHFFLFFRFYSQSCGKYSYCILSTNFLYVVYFALAYMYSLLLLVYWVVVLLVVILPFCLLIILVIFVSFFFPRINMCCFILRNI